MHSLLVDKLPGLAQNTQPSVMTRFQPVAGKPPENRHPMIASAEEIIAEARNGRMYILVDDEDRENEGDLIIPGQFATPDAINFMARYGRGLICLALTTDRVEQLGLPMMSSRNRTRHETAFTVSIEAREGVDTGISACDRSRTVGVAIDPRSGPQSIVTPGHVFPLAARRGGVLARAGHTEAAVDVSRLAGLNPSGVICEIMNDDGTMARLDDLVGFGQLHGLKIGTIRDLIAYRRRHDQSIEELKCVRFESRWGGEWTLRSFRSIVTGQRHIALIKGEVLADKPTLVRVHALSAMPDLFGQISDRGQLLECAMKTIAEAGSGVVVVIDHCSTDGLADTIDAVSEPVVGGQLRDYGVGAEILAHLGVHDMILLTNSRQSLVALDGFGLSIIGELPVD